MKKVLIAVVLILATLCATGFVSNTGDIFVVAEDSVSWLTGLGNVFSKTYTLVFGSEFAGPLDDDDICTCFFLEDEFGNKHYFITEAREMLWGYFYIVGLTKHPCIKTDLNLSDIRYAKVGTRVFLISKNLVIYNSASSVIGRYRLCFDGQYTYGFLLDQLEQDGYEV